MNDPGDCQPELWFGIVDRVTAYDRRARFVARAGRPFDDPAQQLEPQGTGPADEIESRDGTTAHRVDIGQRVRRRDPPPIEGVVDNGCEEVNRLNDRRVRRDAIDRRIVGRRKTDEEGRVVARDVYVTQDLRQLGGSELACSAAAV
jgi:hypothetical protein